MTLQDLKDILLKIGPPVFHYFVENQKGNYIVWAEDGEAVSLNADGQKVERVITGTIDYFTKDENDPVVEQIQEALNILDDFTLSLNSIQYEEDTGYIHYEWAWEMV